MERCERSRQADVRNILTQLDEILDSPEAMSGSKVVGVLLYLFILVSLCGLRMRLSVAALEDRIPIFVILISGGNRPNIVNSVAAIVCPCKILVRMR